MRNLNKVKLLPNIKGKKEEDLIDSHRSDQSPDIHHQSNPHSCCPSPGQMANLQ